MTETIGWHFYLDAEMSIEVSKKQILFLLKKIPKKINMGTLSEPIVLDGAKHNPGATGFVIIEFSHIAIHTFEKTNKISIDIFSCKAFDYNELFLYLKNVLALTKLKFKMITREL